MTKVRALLGVLAVIVLMVSAAGCGIVSDQTKREANKRAETDQKDLEKKVDDLKKKVQRGQEDLKEVDTKEQHNQ